MALTRPATGSWTYEDLLALPDDGRRWEIVEGELHEMPAPSWAHAVIIANLIAAWFRVVRAVGGVIVAAPVDVFFAGASPVEPDILVLLPGNPAAPSARGLEGAPDLVVEVLSPSSRGHDLLTKRALYARAGVREYWLVDPDRRTVDVLTLEGEGYRTAQQAAGGDIARSGLLADVAIALPEIFAGVDSPGADADSADA